jgi:hypothetical protein
MMQFEGSNSENSDDENLKMEAVQDGRWTREEHHNFLTALSIYGKEVGFEGFTKTLTGVNSLIIAHHLS